MYRLVQVKNYKNGRVRMYQIQNSRGEVKDLSREQVRQAIYNGHVIEGIKLSKDGKILLSKNNIQRIANEKNLQTIDKYTEELYKFGDVKTGRELEIYITLADKYIPRNIVKDIVNYNLMKRNMLITVVYGIRRTGKTTAILHAIKELIAKGIKTTDILYISIKKKTFGMGEAISYFENCKATYIFIDEVTNFIDFEDNIKWYADSLAMVKKLTLTGTYSYTFYLAEQDLLFGRTNKVRSTKTSYEEYVRLWGNKNWIDYQVMGGIYALDNVANTSEIRLRIVKDVAANILHSSEVFISKELEVKYLRDEQIAYTILNILLHTVRASTENKMILDKQFLDENIKSTLNDILDVYETKADKELADLDKIKKNVYVEVFKALLNMDIIKRIQNKAYNIGGVEKESDFEYIGLIQGIEYSLMQGVFKLADLNGASFENMIILQCLIWTEKLNWEKQLEWHIENTDVGYTRYKCNNNTYEVDCIVKVTIRNGTELKDKITAIEIKYSNKPNTRHLKTLKSSTLEKALQSRIDNRCVVYTGETQVYNGIQYINVEEFMLDVGKWVMR